MTTSKYILIYDEVFNSGLDYGGIGKAFVPFRNLLPAKGKCDRYIVLLIN